MDNQFTWLINLTSILPEIVLIVCLLSILIINIIEPKFLYLSYITLFSLLISIFLLIFQWGNPYSTTFLGSFQTDGLSIFFRCIIALSSFLSLLLSTKYIETANLNLAEFLTFLLSATIGGMFLCGSNDLITIFVSLECLSLPCYLLCGYTKKDVRSNEAAMKYLLLGGASSSLLAYGFSWLYGISEGKTQLQELVVQITNSNVNYPTIWISIVCIIVSIGFKLSVVPFHQWTPDVYEGSPTPVVAFLSVGSKAAGLALIIRLFSIVFPLIENQWSPVLQILAILSMIFGNLIAATQTNIKRMLAYSSISQIGYLIIGVLAHTIEGYASVLAYLLVYTFMNLGAFSCIINFSLKTGTDQIRDYTGLYLKDPWLCLCFTICLLSLAGIPPLAGFFGKLYIFWSGWKAELYWLVGIGLLTNVVSLYYYLRVIKIMLVKEPKEMSIYVQKYLVPYQPFLFKGSIEFSVTLCAFASTIISFYINPIIEIANKTIVLSSVFV